MNLPGKAALSRWFTRIWYQGSSWYLPLLPLSWLFDAIRRLRKHLYEKGILESFDVGKPVIVVGNIASGGTGKTPVTLWLAAFLKDQGFRPGIVSRGYGGKVGPEPLPVGDDSDARVVGDEPLLMARRAICPVVVHPDRVAAAKMLLGMGCDIIVADDGLQHYRLRRHFEIAVVDGARGFGNGRLLPAGPLREPVARLASVDRVMVQGSGATVPALASVDHTRFDLAVSAVHDLASSAALSLDAFRGKKVNAIAAIGNPQRFFRLLEEHGVEVIPHVLPDHAPITAADLSFDDRLDVLMTEKDAVKIQVPARPHWWYVAVDLKLSRGEEWLRQLVADLHEAETGR